MPAQQQSSEKSRSRGARSAKQQRSAEDIALVELKEIYSAEKQLTRALPQLAKAVQTESVRSCFETRLEQAERLMQDLEGCFESMGASPGRAKNVVAEALIADAREHVQEVEKGPALDTVLIAAMQKTEHYCIAAWGASRALAEAMGEQEIAGIMQRALDEGKALDDQLTSLAEEEVTPMLIGDDEDDEDDDA